MSVSSDCVMGCSGDVKGFGELCIIVWKHPELQYNFELKSISHRNFRGMNSPMQDSELPWWGFNEKSTSDTWMSPVLSITFWERALHGARPAQAC